MFPGILGCVIQIAKGRRIPILIGRIFHPKLSNSGVLRLKGGRGKERRKPEKEKKEKAKRSEEQGREKKRRRRKRIKKRSDKQRKEKKRGAAEKKRI